MPSTHSQKRNQPTVQVEEEAPRIETEEEYELAIGKIEFLWDAPDGTPEAEAREVLVLMVEDYEQRYEDFG